MHILGAGLYACLKPIPVNAEMIGDESVFVQENEQEISGRHKAVMPRRQGKRKLPDSIPKVFPVGKVK